MPSRICCSEARSGLIFSPVRNASSSNSETSFGSDIATNSMFAFPADRDHLKPDRKFPRQQLEHVGFDVAGLGIDHFEPELARQNGVKNLFRQEAESDQALSEASAFNSSDVDRA